MRASEFNEANLLSVVIGSVVCSNTTGASHEYFDQTGYDRSFALANLGHQVSGCRRRHSCTHGLLS
jgi:hypothetical protein